MAAESDYDALKLENQLCFPLYACSRSIVNLYTPFLKPLGLTYTQYIVFLVLWEQDGITVGELGAKLHLDNGTITPLLKKMQDKGYVTRERSKSDERVVIVSLTDSVPVTHFMLGIPRKKDGMSRRGHFWQISEEYRKKQRNFVNNFRFINDFNVILCLRQQ